MTVARELPREFNWLLGQHDDTIHLVPSEDEADHFLDDCWCYPRVFYALPDEHPKKMMMHRPYVQRCEVPEVLGELE